MKERIDTLLSLNYPTRQDMRECMQLQKEYIAELEQKLTTDNSDYTKCGKCGGTGKYMYSINYIGACDECDGKGYFA